MVFCLGSQLYNYEAPTTISNTYVSLSSAEFSHAFSLTTSSHSTHKSMGIQHPTAKHFATRRLVENKQYSITQEKDLFLME